MVRIFIAAFVAISALLSANFSFAFGLGEITLKSYLNQPFEAEIELREISDLSQEEIIPKLASPEDFARAGLQRDFFLTQLRFEVVLNDNGRSYVKVQSREPVVEPYLDVLIEFLWPEGRLLREYAVLLDPPTYAAQEQVQQQMPVVQVTQDDSEQLAKEAVLVEGIEQAAEMAIEESPRDEVPAAATTETTEQFEAETEQAVKQTEAVAQQDPSQQVQEDAVAVQQDHQTITTRANDTLWSIASQVRPVNSVSVQQTMLAIQNLNPDAFLHNNINYLKKNQVLRIPGEDEIRSLATREAIGIVADQNREWAGRITASGGSLPGNTAQLVGSREVTPMELGEQKEAKLKLVAESGGTGAATGSTDGEGSESGRAQGVDGSEEGDSEFAGTETKAGSDAERLLSVKDQEIAGLQKELAKADKSQATVREQAEETGVVERVAVAETGASEFSESAPTEKAEQDLNFSTESDAAGEKDATVGTEADDSKAADIKAKRAEKSSPGLFEQTWFLAIVAILAMAALGGLGFVLYRKRMAGKSQAASASLPVEEVEGEEGFPNFDDTSGLSDNAFEDDSGSASAEGKDPVSEAEVYVAYGRHAQAVTLLKNAISKGNTDIAVKLKLLEVYAVLGDKGNFDNLSAQVLVEDDSQQEFVDSLAQSIGVKKSTGDSNEFSLDEGESEEFDISLDDLANELDADFTSGSDSGTSAKSAKSALDDLEGALDLDDDLLDKSISTKSKNKVEDDLSLDIDLDDSSNSEDLSFNMDDTVVIAKDSSPKVAADDLDFDFDSAEDSGELSFEDDSKSASPGLQAEDDGLELDMDFSEPAEDSDSELSFEFDDEEPKTKAEKSASNELDLELDLSDELNDELDLNISAETGSEENDDDVESIFSDDNEDFDLPETGDEAATKLDLARAYIDMGDEDGARDILQEVMTEGNAGQKADAQTLLAKL